MAATGSTRWGSAPSCARRCPPYPCVNLLPGIRKTGRATRETSTVWPSRAHRSTISREHVAAYARVCGFPAKDTVPLTYPHILGFPMHLQAMADPAFPFPAIGGVHLTNTITAHRAIAIGETVEVTVPPGEPPAAREGPHRRLRHRGRSPTARPSGKAGRPTSAAGRPMTRLADAPSGPVFDEVPPSGITWRLPGDLGRQYAAVSGDRNPIHLYPSPPRRSASSGRSPTACGRRRAASRRSRTGCPTRSPSRWRSRSRSSCRAPSRSVRSARADTGFAFSLSDPKCRRAAPPGRSTRA